ncbi:MAG: SIR2 family protein, partial [Sulfuricurvum sp.]|uniref:SIR2 family protein n=1 Tax=Sulfuricurvum sp. TaxID=2025608 RepID=UPI003562E628
MKNLNKITTTDCFNEHDINKLMRLIASGKAILFAGAGFSSEAINIQDDEIPIGRVLADKIDKITGERSHQDLLVASEKALDNNLENELIDLLKNVFTIKEIKDYHETIINLPWRRFYTTNYDFVIRDAGLKNSKRIKCVTTSDSVSENLNEKNLCIHINGHIDGLNTETLNSSFKLTDSSYLHSDALNDSPWVDVFQQDLIHASAIIFIGYSLYDYNIKKLLFNFKEEFKNKIYFITREKPCVETKSEQKYGKVINIGVRKFSDQILSAMDIIDDYS